MIFQYKATIPNSKLFFRDFEFQGNTSIYRVMEFVQNQMTFVPDMMILFQGIDAKGKVVREYGLFDMGDGSIDNVTISDSVKKGDAVLRFIYNLSQNLYIDLTFTGSSDADPKAEYPRTAAEKGHAPLQFSGIYVEDDYENRPHGLPHPVEGDDYDADEDGEDGEDENEDEEEVFDADELPEGTE